ncbi:MAG: hypothetical protein WDZ50_05000 [Woeseia sp.]
MNVDRYKIFHAFKYTIYALLTLNVYLFFAEEWAASSHRFVDGIQFGDIIEGFAATIDTAAWVVLLLMFELQTFILNDNTISKSGSRAMHVIRAVCYAVIVYAFYGYLTKLLFLFDAAPLAGITVLCELAGGSWAYAIDLDQYEIVTTINCAELSTANSFHQLSGMNAVVDHSGLIDITRLAWVDVINSGVWLLVVFLLEFDVRLQERQKLAGTALWVSNMCKYVLYSILLMAAVYWGIKGDFVDFWDAFLWLVAFVFIEMNVFEWRQETLDEPPARIQPNNR